MNEQKPQRWGGVGGRKLVKRFREVLPVDWSKAIGGGVHENGQS